MSEAKIMVIAFMLGVPIPPKNKLLDAMFFYAASVNGWKFPNTQVRR